MRRSSVMGTRIGGTLLPGYQRRPVALWRWHEDPPPLRRYGRGRGTARSAPTTSAITSTGDRASHAGDAARWQVMSTFILHALPAGEVDTAVPVTVRKTAA